VTSQIHRHPKPELLPLDRTPYGLEGVTDPEPFAALLGACSEACSDCQAQRLDEIAADPLLTAQLVALGYRAMHGVGEAMGMPMDELVRTFAKTSTDLAELCEAYRQDDFQAALRLAETQDREQRHQVADHALTLWLGAMNTHHVTIA
jgi:hypothetical protein